MARAEHARSERARSQRVILSGAAGRACVARTEQREREQRGDATGRRLAIRAQPRRCGAERRQAGNYRGCRATRSDPP